MTSSKFALSRPTLVRLAAALAIIAGSWYAYRTLYASKRDAILASMESTRSSIATLERQLKGQFEVADRAKAITSTTLGTRLDEVSARYRDGLSRLAETAGLAGVIVDHGEPQEVKSPLLVAKSVPSSLRSSLRSAGDFAVLRGTVRGTGTVEQALAALASMEAQPWVHRVEAFTITPAAPSKGPDRCEIRIEVATLLAPRLRQGKPLELTLVQASERSMAMVQEIAARKAFAKALAKRETVAPVVTVASPASPGEAPPPAQAFAPYEEWRLTGIFAGRGGPEAFLLNVRSGERRTVQRGGAVLDAVLIDAAGERALFEISGKRFEVFNGQTLSSRKPVG
jgi:hypothetical protein